MPWHDKTPVPLTLHTAFTTWEASTAVVVPLLVVAGGYLYAALRVRRDHPVRPWPRRRTGAFLGALATIVVATQSSVGVYDDTLFSVHMVQHLLLIMVAPPLLVFARPITLMLHTTHRRAHAQVKRLVRSRTARVVTRAPVVAVLYAVVVATTHLTPAMNLVVENQIIHDAEHLLYLAVGYLYFLPVVGSEPLPGRPAAAGRFLLLLLTMPVDTAVGVILYLAPHVLFSAYLGHGRDRGPTALADQHAAGLIMWIGSDIIMTAFALALAWRFVRDQRSPGSIGRWVDGRRAAALARDYTAAGVPVPSRLSSRTVDADTDAHVAAYNAYLAGLSRGVRRRR